MGANETIITTMGIIADEVYNTTLGKDYFKDNPDPLVANGTTHIVIDHTFYLTF